ncbi:MAG: hypothetical protein Q8S54_19825 [Bacteroidota bacterium]|nr:hypothetical protein [Bacteroidota bacterium]
MLNHQTKQEIGLFELSDQMKHEVLEEIFYYLGTTGVNERVELFHKWLLEYISTSESMPDKDILLQYEQTRNLLLNLKAISKQYSINFSKTE